jgi:GxxExxY protein
MTENEISKFVVNTAVSVHRSLGPGLLESVYEEILEHEFSSMGLSVRRQCPISIKYKELFFKIGFRADLILENKVILELKSVETLNKAHHKQLFTYLKLTNFKLGFLLNFGAPLMRDGLVRIVNGLPD